MVNNEKDLTSGSSHTVHTVREQRGIGSHRRRPSTIPPPPLPIVQPHPYQIKTKVDEDCVTRRFYVDVFKPVDSEGKPADPVVSVSVDADTTVNSIKIEARNVLEVARRQGLLDIDEDAVTKEIRIRRFGEFSSKQGPNSPAMHIRTLPSDDTLWRSEIARRQNIGARLALPEVLENFFPSVWAMIKKAAAAVSSNAHRRLASRRNQSSLKIREATNEKRRIRLSVNTYSRDLYREIKNVFNPITSPVGKISSLDPSAYSIAVAEPPKITVNALLLRRAEKYSLIIRGRASHPVAIRDIMVFADKKKILYLTNAMRDDAGYMEFSADVPLTGAVNSVLVVARHDDHVMGSQSLMITRET